MELTERDSGEMDVVNEWLRIQQQKEGDTVVEAPLVCRDNFQMMVQAGRGRYCTPREDDAFPYSEMEVGWPTYIEASLRPYGEPCAAGAPYLFGYVPVEVILNIVKRHGGIKWNRN